MLFSDESPSEIDFQDSFIFKVMFESEVFNLPPIAKSLRKLAFESNSSFLDLIDYQSFIKTVFILSLNEIAYVGLFGIYQSTFMYLLIKFYAFVQALS